MILFVLSLGLGFVLAVLVASALVEKTLERRIGIRIQRLASKSQALILDANFGSSCKHRAPLDHMVSTD